MRSVVVVLPASMCAMMPMLRTFVRSVSTSCATAKFPLFRLLGCCCRYARRPLYRQASVSPAVVREGPVRLGHLVGVLASLDGGTQAIARVEQLVRETLDHRLLSALLREGHQPTQGQRGRPLRADLDGNLVGGTTDPAATHLEGGLHVVEGALEGDNRIGTSLLPGLFERTIDNAFGQRFLPVEQDFVDELSHQLRPVDRVTDQRSLGCGALARH